MSRYVTNHNKLYRLLVTLSAGFLIVFLPLVILTLKNAGGSRAAWWPEQADGTGWAHRKQLTLTNDSTDSLASGTTVAVTVDTKGLYDTGRLSADCADLRVLYQPSAGSYTELDRHISYPGGMACNTSESAKVYFRLQADLASAASATTYYIYYGNTHATAPSATDDVFDVGSAQAVLVCPFDGTTACASGETPISESGAVRYSGAESALAFDGIDDNVDLGDPGTYLGDGSGDFTVEGYIYPKKEDTTKSYWQYRKVFNVNGSTVGCGSTITGGIVLLAQNSTTRTLEFGLPHSLTDSCQTETTASFGSVSYDTWYHFAATYDASGKIMKTYLNGNFVDEAVWGGGNTISWNGDSFLSRSQTVSTSYKGKIDEFRISDVVRYTGNFTPLTSPFVRDEHTKLLLHMDENGSDPRNTGKVMDDSGDGNHSAVTGAVYVSGLVGADNGTDDSGRVSGSNTYAGHAGVFIERGTANLIANPGFENDTFDAGWMDSAATPSAIVVSTTTTSSQGNDYYKRTWFDGTRYWVAFQDASNIEFWYSTDGNVWTQNTSASIAIVTTQFSVYADGSNAYIAYLSGYDMLVRKAASYPGTGFSWGNATTVLDGSSTNNSYRYPDITRDSEGQIWLAAMHQSTTNHYVRAIQSTSADDITAWGSTVIIGNSTGSTDVGVSLVPLNSGDMYALMRENANLVGCMYDEQTSDRWEDSAGNDCTNQANQDTVGTLASNTSFFKAVVDPVNYDVHIVYEESAGAVYYVRWDNGTGTNGVWQSTVTLAGNSSFDYAQIAVDTDTGDLYATWHDATLKNITSRYCDVTLAGSECSSAADWGPDAVFFENINTYHVFANNGADGKIFLQIIADYSGDNTVLFYPLLDTGAVNPTVSSVATQPYMSHGDVSANVASAANAADFVFPVTAANANVHTLSAYVQNGSAGVVGSAVTASVAQLMYNSQPVATTYTDAGSGWWRMTYSSYPGYREGYEPSSFTTQGLYTSTSNKYLSQGFRFNQTLPLVQARLVLRKAGGAVVASHYRLAIETDFAGTPSGTLVTDGQSACQATPTSSIYAYYNVLFPDEPVLDSGTQYHLVMKPYTDSGCTTEQSAADVVNYIDWPYRSLYSAYGKGNRSTYSTATWRWTAGTTDHAFYLFALSRQNYGIRVMGGKTVYTDGIQLEENPAATTFTDGSLGTGYAWDGTADNSASTRTKADISYAASAENINPSSGTVSFWLKSDWAGNDSTDHEIIAVDTTSGTLRLYKAADNKLKLSDGTFEASYAVSWNKNTWQHITADWQSPDMHLYLNGALASASANFVEPVIDTSGGINIGSTTSQDGHANSFVSDLRIYDGVLAAAEVTDVYNAGLVSRDEELQVDAFSEDKGANPVGIWHFDEGYGTTAHDSSAYGNHLTLSDSAWSTTSDGAGSQLTRNLSFDGSAGIASRSAGQAGDFNFGTGNFTVSGWFRHPSAVTGTDSLVAKYGSAGYKVYMNSSGYVCAGIDDDATFDPDDSACTATSLADSGWHNFSAVRDTTTLTLYIDGLQAAQDDTLAVSGSLDSTANFAVGVDSGKRDYWDGYIDELVVYPYARTAVQVKTDYVGIRAGQTIGAQAGDPLSEGLVGYWKMDEAGDAARVDYSGNGNHLTVSASDTVDQVGGKYGSAGDFEGGDTEYLSISDASQKGLDLETNTFTMSAWLNVESTSGIFEGIITKAEGGQISYAWGTDSNESFRFWLDDNGFAGGGVELITGGSIYTFGVWTHFTITYDGSFIRLFKNGVEQTTGDFPYATQFVYHQGSSDFMLGYWESQGQYYDGLMDEVRIYNRTLGRDEIRSLYNWAPGPVGWWKMDEGSGVTVADTGDQTVPDDATVTGAEWSPGKYGNALQFNGSDDYADFDTLPDFLNAKGAFTMSAWVNPAFSSNDASRPRRYVSQFGTWGPYIRFSDDGSQYYVECDMYNSSGGNFNANTAFAATPTWSKNTWHFIACRYTGDELELYWDNKLIASDPTATGTVHDTAGTASISNDTYKWWGLIDDFKIYDYSRSQSQMTEDLNADHPAPGSPVGSAVGQWRFEKGYGDTANNTGYSGSAYDGNLAGSGTTCPQAGDSACPSWTNTGKFGKALIFNTSATTDDLVTVSAASGSVLDMDTNAVTIAAWVKTASLNSNMSIVGRGLSDDPCNGSEGWGLFVESGGTVSVGGFGGSCLQTTDTISDATWTHIVGVTDGASSAVYLNGKISVSGTVDVVASNRDMIIGATRNLLDNGYRNYFNGTIDDVTIFNSALTADQIRQLYNQGSTTVLGALSDTSLISGGTVASNSASAAFCVPGSPDSCNGPVGVWNFDENSGTTAYDSISGISATRYSGSPKWTGGKHGSGLNFQSGDSYRRNTPWNPLEGKSAMSISLWVKPDFPETDANIHYFVTNGNQWAIHFILPGVSDYRFRVYKTGGGSSYVDTLGISNIRGKWVHIVGTYDEATGKQEIYLNGILNNTTSAVTGTVVTSTAYLEFGNGGSSPTDAVLDRLLVFDYALTPAQIAWEYNRGAPRAQYDFDECTGTTLHDVAPKPDRGVDTFNGTIEIGASVPQTSAGTCSSGVSTEAWYNGASGRYGSSLKFDGADDVVTVADSAALTFINSTTDSPFSLSAWVNFADDDSGVIAGKSDLSIIGEYRMYLDSADKLNILLESAGGELIVTSDSALSQNTWHLVTAVYDGSETASGMKLYVDGNEAAVTDNSTGSYSGMSNTAANFFIGARKNSGTVVNPLTGKIDDVRLYPYDLTGAQVKTLFNQSSAVRFGN